MKLLKSITLSLVFGLATIVINAEEPPARFDFVRPLGMGGAFTAIADDHNIFNFNPAGMVQRTGAQVTILEVAGGVSEDTLDVIDFVDDNEDLLTNFDDPNIPQSQKDALILEIQNDIAKLDPRIYVGADIASYVSGPEAFGALPFHLGFGAFGVIDSSFRLENGAAGVPLVSYDIHNDIILPLSVAKRFDAPWVIPGRIGIGFTGKVIRRNRAMQERINTQTLDELDPVIAEGFGYGSDLGILHQVTDRTSWGLMVHDFLGTNLSFDAETGENGFSGVPERDTVIRPRTDVGLALVPEKLLWLVPTRDRWTFALDVRDVLNKDEHLFFQEGFNQIFGDNLWTHVHMGVEYRWGIFRARGGANQGYPTFGLGIDLPLIKLDYAFYGRELGFRAGDRRQDNHVASIAFGFGGARNVEARERIIKAKEKKKAKKMMSSDQVPEAEPAEDVMEEKVEETQEEAKPEATTSQEETEEIPQ